jgi:two-component system OmpR family sensor kinase
LCHAKHIIIKSELEDSTLNIDEDRAKLLISNLLSNAIKYSMPNKTITLTLTENSFSIKDEGVGIAKEKQDKIFKLYERGSNIAGGFGVGLSIVKQICSEVGMSIEVESELNKGSTFNLTW